MNELVKEYFQATGGEEAIPYMQIRNNYKLNTQFNGDIESVYRYCIKHKKTWEEVLGVNLSVFEDPNALT